MGDMIAGSSLPPRGAGLTDELPIVTVEFERQPWDASAADAWAKWQGNADLGAPTVRVGFLDRLERATHWLPDRLAQRSIADRVSGWLCWRLPEWTLRAVAYVCAWADGYEQSPREPEPYRETYRPARYVGRAAPVEPRRSVDAVWLIARLWSEQGGYKHGVDEWLAAWNEGIPADYEGSHRRETARGTVAQRERSRVEQQWNASTAALRQIDQRDRMRMIGELRGGLVAAALRSGMSVTLPGSPIVYRGEWIRIRSVA